MENFILKLSEKNEGNKEIYGKYLKLCLKHDQLSEILSKETLLLEKKHEIQEMI